MALIHFCCPVCKEENLTIDRKQLVQHGLSMALEGGKRFLRKGGKTVRIWCSLAHFKDVMAATTADGFIDPPQGLKYDFKGPRFKEQSVDWDKVRAEYKAKK